MSTIEKAIGKLGELGKNAAQRAATGTAIQEPAKAEARPVSSKQSANRVDLDLERLERLGFLTPTSGRGQLNEEIRHIKRPLLINAFRSGDAYQSSNLIMITSARPGEGKTFSSINLAMSIAKERDKTVLLVDADVARPSVSRTLGLTPKLPGLVDYLVDDSLALSDLLLKTNVPNLRVLPAGRSHIHSTELLSSDAMRQLVTELSQRYSDRVVIIDSPPLLATTEAAVLASLVGQVVMVVESEKTGRQEVKDALALLDQSKLIGLVLNKARPVFTSDYYGYYGGYGSSGD
ncbi:MAG TPA: polysaccharide biosynthesis tyrosine autokinase [Candidatus Tenderia electrophaga]|uniref:non-specific protein-tyrosine kinase n=1 Tax=Candidatus Tenderia electrophaga TaxID=1748243 RepID=A0A832N4L8_9GAMM|nr:polysaccharide biosynthesis tyrosine autokinase [Candidatus Tenderia electrophaga]